MYRAKDFDEAVSKATRLIADGGYGHTSSSLYVDAVRKSVPRSTVWPRK